MGHTLIKTLPHLAPGRTPGSARSFLAGVRSSSCLRLPRRFPLSAQGSIMGSTVLATMVAGVGVIVLSSRVAESRFAGFTRSDNLAAREAAEFGLNEIQVKLNSSQFSYLLVTKRSSWSKNDLANDLNTCGVPVLDANGNSMAPSLPTEVSGERVIENSNGDKIAYQLVDFQPPSLPDASVSLAQDQSRPGCNATVAANFGNLNGGSAIITVEGRMERQGKISTFRLKRATHVASPETENTYSFLILGNAFEYKSGKKVVDSLGDSNDIANLNTLNGNICYGKLSDTTCFTNPPLPKATIGCFDVRSCTLNNLDSVKISTLRKYCSDTAAIRKKSKQVSGFTCNQFEEIGGLPPVPTPASSGVIINTSNSALSVDSGVPYDQNISDHWTRASVKYDKCEVKNLMWKCKVQNIATFKSNGSFDKDDGNWENDVNFPYKSTSFQAIVTATTKTSGSSMAKLTNDDLAPGCYFNNFNIHRTAGAAADLGSTAINCFITDMAIDNTVTIDKKDRPSPDLPNFVVHTTKLLSNGSTTNLLPVNIFLHGTAEIKLDKGGIENSDKTDFGWSRLRLLGKAVSPKPDGSISCGASSKITSSKGNDLTNLFVWLPNATLDYTGRTGGVDNSYVVVWVCEFNGPSGNKDNMYSIITPIPRNVALAGLARVIPSFTSTTDSTYRSYGAKDTPA